MLSGLFINGYTFMALFTLVMFGCLYEFSKLIKKINPQRYLLYLPVAFFYIILPLLLLIDLGMNGNQPLQSNLSSPPAPASYSPLFPCAVIFSLWANDTMAYLVGSAIGKTAFSSISPKKTWEGTIGGVVLCLLIIGLAGKYSPAAKAVAWHHWVAIAAICAVFGTTGDLLESKLKRMADVKDTGNILPGHGGFLDRFDSLLIATPFVWLYVKLFL
jgi:phosphatidate cytidylyltransferase